MASDLAWLSARAMLQGLARRRFTAADLATACLTQIAARDPELHAFVRLAPDARRVARASDARRTRRPLEGLPIGIKDIIDTAGLGTEYGSRAFVGHVPAHDAQCVHRLREAGAVIIGKCATTEFANMHPSAARNPHAPAHTPGGSSSGSAAAVAAGMVPLALGTQTGGSVIRPGAFCGVFAFKSSWGRTETHGVHELGRSLDTVGWFARTGEDLGVLAPVLLRGHRRAAPPRQPRFVRLATPFDAVATPEMRRACDVFAREVAKAGGKVAKRRLPAWFAETRDAHRVVISVEASRAFDRYLRETPTKISKHLHEFTALGRANEKRYSAALKLGDLARVYLEQTFDDDDVFIVPGAAGEAPRGLAWTGDPSFSGFWSLLRTPCATLPFARGPAGLPLGVQLVGRIGEDETLLAITAWAAKALDIQAVRPPA
jgi:Asp-tRNA(Asn)/Glu-tRNA(Gln) amidotransferase A subunit family amidase